jgi:hypothetical protein
MQAAAPLRPFALPETRIARPRGLRRDAPRPRLRPVFTPKMLLECNTPQQHHAARLKRLKRRQLLVFFASRKGCRAADWAADMQSMIAVLGAFEVGLILKRWGSS